MKNFICSKLLLHSYITCILIFLTSLFNLQLNAQCYLKIKGAIGGESSCQADGSAIFQIIVDYENAPGNLNINGQTFPVQAGTSANNTTFDVVFAANGTSENVHAFFVNNPSCNDTENNLFVSPNCEEFVECNLEIIDFGSPVCNSDNTYSFDITLSYMYPEGNLLNILGQIFQISGSGTNTFTLINLPSDGKPVDLTASFVYDFTCNDLVSNAFTAPNCSQNIIENTCELVINSVGSPICNFQNNTYSVSVNVNYQNPAGNFININGQLFQINGSGNETFTLNNLTSNGEMVSINASLTQDIDCRDQKLNVFRAPECSMTSKTITVSLRAYLEGFLLSDGNMNRALNDLSIIPNEQPFSNECFNYNGNEYVNNIPDNVVDWILVKIHHESGAVIAQKACLLYENGLVRDDKGFTSLDFDLDAINYKYMSIHHKSHLAVVADISNKAFVDFSVIGNTLGIDQTKSKFNKQVIIAGDLDCNGIINLFDYNSWHNNNAIIRSYVHQDMDGNGIVNNLDYNFWELNKSKVGHPLIQ